MKKLVIIPEDISLVTTNNDDLEIDMSNLHFDCDKEKLKFYSFIFLRNTGNTLKLNFDNCSFEDKEEFLLMFLKSNIEVKSKLLASTWIEILINDDKIIGESILNSDEIKLFISNNEEFIKDVHHFISSLPLYAIVSFKSNIDTTNTHKIDSTEISISNFYQLTEFDSFISLIKDNPHPSLYKILLDKENQYKVFKIMKNLPYMNILKAMYSDNDTQNNIINAVNNYLGGNTNE